MLLSVKDIHTSYGKIRAIKGISFDVAEGEIVTLIGANGAGKSTTLRTLSGLESPHQGTITFDGEDITGKKPHDITKKSLIQVPEGRRVFPQMTVAENLDMGAFLRNDKDGIKEDYERVLEFFPRLQERKNQKAGTLSGGEQQMLAMGRALMAKPKLLTLDEPSMGLAPVIIEVIFEIILKLNAEGITILLIEQNANLALGISDRGYVMETGIIKLSGTGEELLANEEVRKAYLGED
ncbi:MAG: ABC transporter ATP-binding protein [Coriobacteriia bacterium]|nr:ABC transporter ATP-binding protein [Coriobacteriia bacterium]